MKCINEVWVAEDDVVADGVAVDGVAAGDEPRGADDMGDVEVVVERDADADEDVDAGGDVDPAPRQLNNLSYLQPTTSTKQAEETQIELNFFS